MKNPGAPRDFLVKSIIDSSGGNGGGGDIGSDGGCFAAAGSSDGNYSPIGGGYFALG